MSAPGQQARARILTSGNELAWPINDPKAWLNVAETPKIDLERFQQRIDDIVGRTVSNEPIVRIVDMRKRLELKKNDWRLKYRYWSAGIETPDGLKWIDFAPPRYVLEERIEPVRYLQSWDVIRWHTEADGRRVDVMGPAPLNGIYRPFWDIADHRHNCCQRYPNLKCYGIYRPPGDIELEMLAATRKAIEDSDTYGSPQEPMSERELAAIAAESRLFKKEQDEGTLRAWRELLEDKYLSHGWRQFETDATRLRQGRFFFTKRLGGLFGSKFFQKGL